MICGNYISSESVTQCEKFFDKIVHAPLHISTDIRNLETLGR
jgi:hypothetical protein